MLIGRLLAEPTFAESCRMESHFPRVLVESAMSCAESSGCMIFPPILNSYMGTV
jgi:hypothetical protein